MEFGKRGGVRARRIDRRDSGVGGVRGSSLKVAMYGY